eukprot:10931603-Lingulodinium_polyedra.AAC.1
MDEESAILRSVPRACGLKIAMAFPLPTSQTCGTAVTLLSVLRATTPQARPRRPPTMPMVQP